jgi:mRNA interferase MazF
MVDKTMTVRREKIGPVLGRVEPERMLEIERCLAIFLGVAK